METDLQRELAPFAFAKRRVAAVESLLARRLPAHLHALLRIAADHVQLAHHERQKVRRHDRRFVEFENVLRLAVVFDRQLLHHWHVAHRGKTHGGGQPHAEARFESRFVPAGECQTGIGGFELGRRHVARLAVYRVPTAVETLHVVV